MAKLQLIVSQKEDCFTHKIEGNIYSINNHFYVLIYLQKYPFQSCLNFGKFYDFMRSKIYVQYKLNRLFYYSTVDWFDMR